MSAPYVVQRTCHMSFSKASCLNNSAKNLHISKFSLDTCHIFRAFATCICLKSINTINNPNRINLLSPHPYWRFSFLLFISRSVVKADLFYWDLYFQNCFFYRFFLLKSDNNRQIPVAQDWLNVVYFECSKYWFVPFMLKLYLIFFSTSNKIQR